MENVLADLFSQNINKLRSLLQRYNASFPGMMMFGAGVQQQQRPDARQRQSLPAMNNIRPMTLTNDMDHVVEELTRLRTLVVESIRSTQSYWERSVACGCKHDLCNMAVVGPGFTGFELVFLLSLLLAIKTHWTVA